ncbi:DUF1330 domain-containing protein [Streptomyces gardneri]|nr:DUF1330 domain-containing protein [Streptomyces gardneri]MBF6207810.1 DUF1330 domain-containing protein [Streptomyces gardneri]
MDIGGSRSHGDDTTSCFAAELVLSSGGHSLGHRSAPLGGPVRASHARREPSAAACRATYAPAAQKSILSYSGRYLVAGPTPEPVEGTWDSPRFLVIEFPDMDRVRQWYDSPEYRQARQIREGKVRVQMLFAEGAPPKGFSLLA